MAKSSNYWDKRALKRYSDAEKMSEAYIERIKNIYDKANKDIERELESVYRNYAKDTGLDVQKLKELLTRSETAKTWEQMKRQGLDKYVKNNYKARISRLEQVQAQIYAKAKLIYPKEELEQTMAYKGVINDSYYKAVYDTQKATGYNFTFSKIDKNTLDSILNERWSGLNYSERIWGNTDILAESLSEVLGGAMLSGQSIEKTSKQIRDRFKVSKYYAERLVRTETNHFNNMADAMAYEELGVDYYVFVATLDSRTSEKCQNMDGKKFAYKDKQEGVNFPPLHPNCRSKTRGYVDEETEKSLQRRAKNPITGKNEVIGNMSYAEWLDKQKIRYGDNAIKNSFKKVKNKAVDKSQYERYSKFLGNEIKTFDNFQNIKYNDSKTWGNIKSYVRESKKGEIPSGLSFKQYNKNINGENWKAVDFSPNRITNHYNKHKTEFGDITIEEYSKKANSLLNSKTNDNILGFVNDNGFVFKYNKRNNTFATSKPSGVIETYFKPKNGLEYWEEQVKIYGNKKDV